MQHVHDCMISACATDCLHSWCSSCVHTHLEDHLQVAIARRFTAHTQPASTAQHKAGGCWSSGTLPAMLCSHVSGKPHKDISRVPGGTCEGLIGHGKGVKSASKHTQCIPLAANVLTQVCTSPGLSTGLW